MNDLIFLGIVLGIPILFLATIAGYTDDEQRRKKEEVFKKYQD